MHFEFRRGPKSYGILYIHLKPCWLIHECLEFFNFQNNPDNPKKGISTESMSLEEYAQKDIRERKEKEMAAMKDIRLKVA